MIRHEYLSGRGERTQPRRLDDGRSVPVAVVVCRVASGDPDPDGEGWRAIRLRQAGDRLLQSDGASDRSTIDDANVSICPSP